MLGMRPLIGVTTSEVRARRRRSSQTPQGEPPRREMALGLTYLRAIEAAGGLPVVMPPLDLEAVEPLLDRLGGICLSGGPDLDPAAYDERRHPAARARWSPSSTSSSWSWRGAPTHRGLPILAICRGPQALNVARGGTLHQHLPDRPGTTIDHRQRAPGDTRRPTRVEVAAGSRLARLMGRREARVNSFHHQAVDRLGRGPARGRLGARRGDRGRRGARRATSWSACSGTPRRSCARREQRRAVRGAGRGRGAQPRAAPEAAGGMSALPTWADWTGGAEYTLGAEEEVMLLNPHDWSLAQQIDRVLPRAVRRSCPST